MMGDTNIYNETAGESEIEKYNYTTNASGVVEVLGIPEEMQFNDSHLIAIIGYSLLFVLSALGNLTIMVVILRRRCQGNKHLYKIDFMLGHLAVADLMVTLFMMPLEIIWASTVSWHGGDFMCRTMAFFRIFGLYLSSFILVCLALDRYLAVRYPMRIVGSMVRGKLMVISAWILSTLSSLPQVFIFHEARHPQFNWYVQCVSFGSLSPQHEWIYNLFVMLMMYAIPFAVILLLYCGIVLELQKRTRSTSASRGRRLSETIDSGSGELKERGATR